jgi:hypothetical protein
MAIEYEIFKPTKEALFNFVKTKSPSTGLWCPKPDHFPQLIGYLGYPIDMKLLLFFAIILHVFADDLDPVIKIKKTIIYQEPSKEVGEKEQVKKVIEKGHQFKPVPDSNIRSQELPPFDSRNSRSIIESERETPVCLFHPVKRRFENCVRFSYGACRRWNGTCESKNTCVYDFLTSSYKTCTEFRKGVCSKFGEACLPEPATCLIDGKTYRICEKPNKNSGTCDEFSTPCKPTM